jgi:hypothetical protein
MTLVMTSACDKLADTSRTAQSVSKNAFMDTKASWRDFFTYHPELPDAMPQTRYCYQMQSDVVCYDEQQRQLTSKLVGYQDGENISWVQPGGGSLGGSGGEPVSLRPMPKRQTADTNMNETYSVNTTAYPATTSSFATSTISPTSGQIDVSPLPPIKGTVLKSGK